MDGCPRNTFKALNHPWASCLSNQKNGNVNVDSAGLTDGGVMDAEGYSYSARYFRF